MDLDTKLTMDLLKHSVASEAQPQRSELARYPSKMDQMVAKYTSPDCDRGDRGHAQSRSYCRPWNYADYLTRLGTFREAHRWFAKPAHLSPPECALKGWSCSETDSDTLICKCCQAKLKFDTTEQATASEAAHKLNSGHSGECGWRSLDGTSCCDRSFLDLPGLQSERSLCVAVVARAASVVDALLRCGARDVDRPAASSAVVTVRSESGAPAGSSQPQEPLLLELKHLLDAAARYVQSNAPSPSKREATAEPRPGPLLEVARAARELLQRGTGGTAEDGAESAQLRMMKAVLFIAASGWQCSSRGKGQAAVGDGGSADTSSSLQCSLCSRSISLLPPVASPQSAASLAEVDRLQQARELRMDCTAQHRYFCPFVNCPAVLPAWLDSCPSDAANTSRISEWRGWEVCALAVSRHGLSHGAVALTAGGDNQGVGNGTDARPPACEEAQVPPEQAYKRIRSVLDFVGK